MTLYVVTEVHEAEGSRLVGVFDRQPTAEDLKACRAKSSYGDDERRFWCRLLVTKFEANVPCTFAEQDNASYRPFP